MALLLLGTARERRLLLPLRGSMFQTWSPRSLTHASDPSIFMSLLSTLWCTWILPSHPRHLPIPDLQDRWTWCRARWTRATPCDLRVTEIFVDKTMASRGRLTGVKDRIQKGTSRLPCGSTCSTWTQGKTRSPNPSCVLPAALLIFSVEFPIGKCTKAHHLIKFRRIQSSGSRLREALPPRDIWQHLDTFRLSQLGEDTGV